MHSTFVHSPPLHPDQLTWAALLARWVAFARQAVGLPETDEGERMRASVPHIIMLQAVWFALQHLDELAPDERALGLDRAELLIEEHTAALRDRWRDADMPALLTELIADAEGQLRKTLHAGP